MRVHVNENILFNTPTPQLTFIHPVANAICDTSHGTTTRSCDGDRFGVHAAFVVDIRVQYVGNLVASLAPPGVLQGPSVQGRMSPEDWTRLNEIILSVCQPGRLYFSFRLYKHSPFLVSEGKTFTLVCSILQTKSISHCIIELHIISLKQQNYTLLSSFHQEFSLSTRLIVSILFSLLGSPEIPIDRIIPFKICSTKLEMTIL